MATIAAFVATAALVPLAGAYDGPAYIGIPEGISECENAEHVGCLQMTGWIMSAGTTARWINSDSAEHWFSVIPISKSMSAQPFDTGKLPPSRWMEPDFDYDAERPFDYGFEHVFVEPGVYLSSCLIHPWIYHTIEIKPKANAPDPGSTLKDNHWGSANATGHVPKAKGDAGVPTVTDSAPDNAQEIVYVSVDDAGEEWLITGPGHYNESVPAETRTYTYKIHRDDYHVTRGGITVGAPLECRLSVPDSNEPSGFKVVKNSKRELIQTGDAAVWNLAVATDVYDFDYLVWCDVMAEWPHLFHMHGVDIDQVIEYGGVQEFVFKAVDDEGMLWTIAGPEDYRHEVRGEPRSHTHQAHRSDFFVTRDGATSNAPLECSLSVIYYDTDDYQHVENSYQRLNHGGSVTWNLSLGDFETTHLVRCDVLGDVAGPELFYQYAVSVTNLDHYEEDHRVRQEEFELSLREDEMFNSAMEEWEIASGPEDVYVEVGDEAAEYVHVVHKGDFLVTRNGIPADHPLECHVRSYGWDERPMQGGWENARWSVTSSVSWSLPVGYHHVLCGDLEVSHGLLFHGHLVNVMLPSTNEAKGDAPSPATPNTLHAKGDTVAGDRLVVIETASGTLTIELFDADAPNHADNLRSLADAGYYDGTLFHRIIPGFMIQGGDANTRYGEPATWGHGGKAHGPGDTIGAEFNDIKHVPGIVSMARKGGDPDSAGSQFFVMHGDAEYLDGEYTVLGRIVTEESYRTLVAMAALETNSVDQPIDAEAARIHRAYTIERPEAAGVLHLGEPERSTDAVAEAVPEGRIDAALVAPASLKDGVYRNDRLGVSFEPPAGWSVQELPTPKQSPKVPDLIVVGPEGAGLPPVISLDVQPAGGRTLAGHIGDRNSLRAAAVEAGELEIGKAEITTLGGLEALAQDVRGIVESRGDMEVAFREVAAESGGKFYTLTHMSMVHEFEANMGLFEGVLGTLTLPAGDPRARGDEAAAGLFTSRSHEAGFGLVMGLYGGGLGDDDALRAIKYFHSIGAMAFDIGAGDGVGGVPARPVCEPDWPVGSVLTAVAFGDHSGEQKRHCLELLAERGHFEEESLGF